jgi:tetratricopeptide (TPR) repeat protein
VKPSVSLCLIVRDEEAFLEGCLDAASPWVDEIVVVDTGSTDATVSIAEARGARVGFFNWCADFAAARNASLDLATGDFVFVLDADERLASGPELRRLVESEPPGAPPTLYLPLIENVDAAGRPLGADHMPRLWRRRPALRFTGRVHERVGEGVPGLVRRYEDALRIVHLGYDPEIKRARGKSERNRALLQAELTSKPGDPALLFYLGNEHYAAGEDEAALACFRAVVADGRIVNFALGSALFGAECLRALGRPAEALGLAEPLLGQHADYGELWYVAGQAALDVGDPALALACFERSRLQPAGIAATAFRDPSVSAWRADVARGRLLLALGRAEGRALLAAAAPRVTDPDERAALETLLR